ncbi:uncharacterized protein EDB91DRAFT_1083499, partial [Suillus paluster]|uniref:uncharacterized protein n=1 Tax=Suillus paluster TaxID=48578 RepID=UPI001B874713
MSSTTPLPVTSAIRVVAFLLKDHVACDIAESAATQLTDALTPWLVDHVVAAIAPQVARVHTSSKTMASTLEQAERVLSMLEREKTEKESNITVAAERIEEAANILFSSVEDCQNVVKALSPSLEATQNHLNLLSTQISTLPSKTTSLPQPSYSSVVASQLQPSVDKAVGRAAIRACQVLLDPMLGETLFPPNMSNSDIAKKLKEALMKARDNSTPPGSIRAVMALRNGGIVIEMESESLAKWMNSPLGRTALESNMESAIEAVGFLCQVEWENGL